MKLFIDVDNTILEHYHFYSKDTENRTHRAIGNNVKINKDAIDFMYRTSITVNPKALRNLWNYDNVYILTKYPNDEFDYYKQKKLAEVLNISQEDLVTQVDSKGRRKYLNVLTKDSKVQFVKELFRVEEIKDFILIDDYSSNITEWEDAGGLGIKFYNEYNSPTHPTIGLTITDFSIVELLMENHHFSKVFLQYNKSLLLEQFISYLIKTEEFDKSVDVDYDVYKHSLSKLDIVDESINIDYLNFSKEYYNMLNKLDPKYWYSFWEEYIFAGQKIIFKSSFYVNVDNICDKIFKDKNHINIAILTGKDKAVDKADLYITINESANYLKGKEQIKRIKEIFEEII